jgi:hypothetical protein
MMSSLAIRAVSIGELFMIAMHTAQSMIDPDAHQPTIVNAFDKISDTFDHQRSSLHRQIVLVPVRDIDGMKFFVDDLEVSV